MRLKGNPSPRSPAARVRLADSACCWPKEGEREERKEKRRRRKEKKKKSAADMWALRIFKIFFLLTRMPRQ